MEKHRELKDAILNSGEILPSYKANNPKDARYGDGQYFSDITPDTYRTAQLASRFIKTPNKYKYTHYIEIDISKIDLNHTTVLKGRDGVYVVIGSKPLKINTILAGSGEVKKE